MHGWVAKELHEVLPQAGSKANNHPEKSKKLLHIMVQAVLAGAEMMWRVTCDLVAGLGEAKAAMSRRMKQQAKVSAIMQHIKGPT